jgi:tight adherence protein B
MIPTSIGSGDIWYALALSGLFASIFILISALYRLVITPWRRRREVAKRVQDEKLTMMVRSGLLRSEFEGSKHVFIKIIEKVFSRERLADLQKTLFQADIYTGLHRFLNIVILCACVGIMTGWYFRSLFLQLALGFGAGCLPFLYLRNRKKRKARLIEQQMPDTMELLARSLRAGHTLTSAVEVAAQEISPPLGTELRLSHEEQRLGLTIAEALEHMSERATSKELRFFVAAINIQHEVGGNLAELMENISALIRGRLNLKAKVRALTSEARTSATILSIFPFVVFFVTLNLIPDYTRVLLTDPTGRKLLVGGVILIILGAVIMNKLADLKV